MFLMFLMNSSCQKADASPLSDEFKVPVNQQQLKEKRAGPNLQLNSE